MSPLFASAQPSAGREGSAAVSLQISCRCALCDIELSLLSNLTDGDGSFSEFKLSLNGDDQLSIPELLHLLKASPADSRSDEVLAGLLRFRSKRPTFADAILVLAFVPMLHHTVRRVLAFQPSMANEDVVQQTLGILLQFLGSDDLQVRQSHFAFAISRAVKREAFAWAAREGSKHALLDYNGDAFALFASDEPFERYTQLPLSRPLRNPGRPHRRRIGSARSVQTGERQRRRFRNIQWNSAKRSPAETQAIACQAAAPGAIIPCLHPRSHGNSSRLQVSIELLGLPVAVVQSSFAMLAGFFHQNAIC